MAFDAQKLKTHRVEKLKMSRRQFLSRLLITTGIEITDSRLQRFENGGNEEYKTDFSSEEIAAICKFTRKSPNFYFGYEEKEGRKNKKN